MSGLSADLRHAWHVYRNTPVGSALAVAALAVAMACVTASFSLLDDLELKAHPGFADSGSLVTLGQSNGERFAPLSLRFLDEADAGSVALIAGVHESTLMSDVQGVRNPMRVEMVTAGYSRGLQPAVRLGRAFEAQDHQPGAEPVAVLSFEAWNAQFGGRPDVLGEQFVLNGRQEIVPMKPGAPPEPPKEQSLRYRIVGVFAPELPGTFARDTRVWLPYEQAGPVFVGGGELYRQVPTLKVVVRPKPGVSTQALQAELEQRVGTSGRELGFAPGFRIDAIHGVVGDIDTERSARRQVRLLFAGSVLLALVAASNISLFLFSQAPRRQRELAIRLAVGATNARLARQLITEGTLLVVVATAAGYVVSLWLSVLLQNTPLLRGAEWHSVTPLEGRILGMVIIAALVLSILVSLAPLLGIRQGRIAASSRNVSSRASGVQRLAGATQLTIASVLTGAALAFGWYLGVLANADRGFESADRAVITFESPGPGSGFMPSRPDQILALRESRRASFMRLPGVHAVTFGNAVPGLKAPPFIARVPKPTSSSGEMADVQLVSSDANYPDVLGMTVLHGRKVEPSELDAIVVNETLAQSLWGRTNVVGEVLGQSRMRIVGVLRDARFDHPSAQVPAMAFRLATPSSSNDVVIVQSSQSPAELERLVRQAAEAGSLDAKVASVSSLDDLYAQLLASDRARTLITSSSALIVVLLAALGFYGTLHALVVAGRREYAIRSAIGAGPSAVRRLVLTRGLFLGIPGVILGVLLTFVLVVWMRDELLSRAVPAVWVTSIVALATLGLILVASLGPAIQASSAAPAPELKED